MAVERIDIDRFLEYSGKHLVIDVRSPSEYSHAHLPVAQNIPLFSDDERSTVGTLYKQQGRGSAVLKGLEYFGPRMTGIIQRTERMIGRGAGSGITSEVAPAVLVYCWRGGMRSAGVAWLLDLYGFTVFTLEGGYKAFRKWVLDTLEKPMHLNILGGYTGSGKTGVLYRLKEIGHHVIDLESLASHKGSAFGGLGMSIQPSQEMFENLLAMEMWRCMQKLGDGTVLGSTTDVKERIWIEDESQRIGRVNIPSVFWKHMRTQPVHFLDIPFAERLERICNEYGRLDKDQLVAAITRIRKRLGGLETKTAIEKLIEDDVKGSFEVLLRYYDKTYEKSLQNRPGEHSLVKRYAFEKRDGAIIAETISRTVNGNYS